MTTHIYITTIEEVIAAAKPGMYIAANNWPDGTMDVILWETEADWENDNDDANAIGRWLVDNVYIIREGVVDEDTFG